MEEQEGRRGEKGEVKEGEGGRRGGEGSGRGRKRKGRAIPRMKILATALHYRPSIRSPHFPSPLRVGG